MPIFPVASGAPDYSSAGDSKYTPELFSQKVIVGFYDKAVVPDITNTDHEEEIKKYGDKLTMRTRPTVSVFPYAANMDLEYETPESDPITLVIDKGFWWGFNVDDVNRFQWDVDMESQMAADAAEQGKKYVEQDVLQNIYAEADQYNMGNSAGRDTQAIKLGEATAPVTITSKNAVRMLMRMELCLDEYNVSEENRWVVLPPWYIYLLRDSELKDVSLTGDGTSPIRNGLVGRVGNFKIYVSRNLKTVTDSGTGQKCTYILGGHKLAVTFASQIVKTDSLTSERRFAKIMRGLQVYGYEVIYPKALTVGYVTFCDE